MRIENKINEIIDLCIKDKDDLNIEHLSHMFDVHLMYNHKTNFYTKRNDIDLIALKFDQPHVMFENFCHEAAHMFLHQTNQNIMSDDYNRLQEAEAHKFSMCLMLPESLIFNNELFNAEAIRDYFNVSLDVAIERIEMLIKTSKLPQYT